MLYQKQKDKKNHIISAYLKPYQNHKKKMFLQTLEPKASRYHKASSQLHDMSCLNPI